MKALTKILLTISVSVFFIGVVMCGMAFVIGGTDLSKMDFDTAYEATEYVSTSTLTKNIEINADRHDIIIKESLSASNVTIQYSENQYDKFSVTDDGNTVTLTNKDSKNAFIRFFCLIFDSKNKDEKTITLTVPARYTGNINVVASKADVNVNGLKNTDSLNIDLDDGDIVLDTLNCTNAKLEIATGNILISGGTYVSLDITSSNPVQYLPIDEVDPELWPSGIITPTETPTISESPSQTLSPLETPSATDSPSTADETGDTENGDSENTEDATPDVTPSPTATPSATKTPSILVVEASVTFDNVDVQNLTINTIYTNIEGSLARGEGYYKITTNNETSSNIKTNENSSAVGTITISQKEGKTEIEFK